MTLESLRVLGNLFKRHGTGPLTLPRLAARAPTLSPINGGEGEKMHFLEQNFPKDVRRHSVNNNVVLPVAHAGPKFGFCYRLLAAELVWASHKESIAQGPSPSHA